MEEGKLAYRWPMAIWTLLVGLFVGGMCVGFLPPLFNEIDEELGLTNTQIGVIWGAAGLGTLLTALGGGMMADRYGAKKIIAAGLFLSIPFCVMRAVFPSFWGLTTSMFLLGTAMGLIVPNTAKAIGMWFGPKELGTALGLLAVGGALGTVIALMIGVPLSNALGGWRNVMYLTGGICAAIFIMWVVLARERPPTEAQAEAAAARRPMLEGLRKIMRVRDLWLVCMMELCITGAIMGFMGHFPHDSVDRLGMSPGMAGILTGLGAAAVVVTSVLGPLFSDRVGLRRPFLWPFMLVGLFGATFMGIASGASLFILVLVLGASIGVVLPLFQAVIIENPRIGPLLAGSALGLLYMVNCVGATLVPIVMGWIQDATAAYWQAYLFFAILDGGGALFGYLIKETGLRSKKGIEAA